MSDGTAFHKKQNKKKLLIKKNNDMSLLTGQMLVEQTADE